MARFLISRNPFLLKVIWSNGLSAIACCTLTGLLKMMLNHGADRVSEVSRGLAPVFLHEFLHLGSNNITHREK